MPPLWLLLTLFELAVALVALRLYFRRSRQEMLVEEVAPPKWCHLELFGHTDAWGLVEDTDYGGRRWLRVTAPEIHIPASGPDGKHGTIPRRVKLYHPNAVYAITEHDERTVMRALGRRDEWGPDVGEASVRIHVDTSGMRLGNDDDIPF